VVDSIAFKPFVVTEYRDVDDGKKRHRPYGFFPGNQITIPRNVTNEVALVNRITVAGVAKAAGAQIPMRVDFSTLLWSEKIFRLEGLESLVPMGIVTEGNANQYASNKTVTAASKRP
jgi:hypothetical protein